MFQSFVVDRVGCWMDGIAEDLEEEFGDVGGFKFLFLPGLLAHYIDHFLILFLQLPCWDIFYIVLWFLVFLMNFLLVFVLKIAWVTYLLVILIVCKSSECIPYSKVMYSSLFHINSPFIIIWCYHCLIVIKRFIDSLQDIINFTTRLLIK